jgi:AcrR family transcriptional regulator
VRVELPVVQPGTARPERADAARNRERILAAARELVRERGIEAVSMDDVARRACVGTGTLYRRFGDRAGLAIALLDEADRAFQDGLLRGAPPLGPGAPARERLAAFGEGYVALLEDHAELMAAAGGVGGPVDVYTTHLAILLREAAPEADVQYVAEALMAALDPARYVRQRRGLGWTPERIAAGWQALACALVRAG